MNWKNILAAALAAGASLASAQEVWRCGNSYSSQPCPGGTAVSAADARSGSDAARATQSAQADARRAAEMEKTRLAQEKAAPKAVVMASPQPAQPPARSDKNGTAPKKGKLEQFTAVSPGAGGKKRQK